MEDALEAGAEDFAREGDLFIVIDHRADIPHRAGRAQVARLSRSNRWSWRRSRKQHRQGGRRRRLARPQAGGPAGRAGRRVEGLLQFRHRRFAAGRSGNLIRIARVKVLGDRPGTAVTGFGVVTAAPGRQPRLIECGVLRPAPRIRCPTGSSAIHDGVSSCWPGTGPTSSRSKECFYGSNVALDGHPGPRPRRHPARRGRIRRPGHRVFAGDDQEGGDRAGRGAQAAGRLHGGPAAPARRRRRPRRTPPMASRWRSPTSPRLAPARAHRGAPDAHDRLGQRDPHRQVARRDRDPDRRGRGLRDHRSARRVRAAAGRGSALHPAHRAGREGGRLVAVRVRHAPGERQIFQRLLGASGFGPKLAIAMLSSLGPERTVRSIKEKDLAALSTVSGIGRKKAERLVLELSDRFGDVVLDSASGAAARRRRRGARPASTWATARRPPKTPCGSRSRGESRQRHGRGGARGAQASDEQGRSAT